VLSLKYLHLWVWKALVGKFCVGRRKAFKLDIWKTSHSRHAVLFTYHPRQIDTGRVVTAGGSQICGNPTDSQLAYCLRHPGGVTSNNQIDFEQIF